jgi:hypothetical protein
MFYNKNGEFATEKFIYVARMQINIHHQKKEDKH